MVMTQWLAVQMDAFVAAVTPLGVEQEQTIADLCRREIAAWRARPTMRVMASLKVPMTDARKVLRARLAVTERNSWLNPRTGEREHLALKYLNFTEDEWRAINAPSEEALRERRENPGFVPDPEAVVAKAASLLESSYWQDMALGLSVLTGRRVTEILKTGSLHPSTDWTVEFKGQLKKRNEVLPPYEIPTLLRADLVLAAWHRLRDVLDCSALTKEEVDARYAPEVRAVATRHFGALVPTRVGHEEQLYTHLFRCIYGQIAKLYFAPDTTPYFDYMAEIYGHYWYKDEADPQKKMNFSSTLHYMDYLIGAGPGLVDLRQGIKLGEPGVVVLKAFQPKPSTRKKGKAMAETNEKTSTTEPAKKSSLFRCTQATKARGKQMIVDRELRAKQVEDLFLNQVFDQATLYEQMQKLLAPFAETPEAEPVTTLHQVLASLEQPAVRQHLVGEHLKLRWGISLEDLDRVFTKAQSAGHEKPLEYLEEELGKQGNQRQGAQIRQEALKRLDYPTLPFEQLENLKSPEAALERTRRAVQAIMAHNQQADRLALWYINIQAILDLVGGSSPLIKEYLAAHAQEIEAHHLQYDIHPRFNQKALPITEMVHIPGQKMTPLQRKELRAAKRQLQSANQSAKGD
jgi:Telomere resolvase ResT/TelK catalytic domain